MKLLAVPSSGRLTVGVVVGEHCEGARVVGSSDGVVGSRTLGLYAY